MVTVVLFALSSSPTFPRNLWEIGSESSCTTATFEPVFPLEVKIPKSSKHQKNKNHESQFEILHDQASKQPDDLFIVELHRDCMAEDGPHACDSIQCPVPKDLGFEFGLLCVGGVGEHLSEVPVGEL
ncbi:hypothetical protein V6N11_054563 [Hibiscus sabdariffa]|uniref:Uncharacterized protein n=1 Tax=Hibiscus sabdariffa TaxID=183260 RepID=A0ABR2S4F6_9ROSI